MAERGLVQVWGPPDERELLKDERLCTTPEEPEHVVVFHVSPVWLSNGGWACASCCFATEPPDGTA